MSSDEVITAELVAELVAQQFPAWAHLPVRPVEADGWDNRTFRLGEDLSVRLPSGEAYAAQIDKEHRWLPLLAAGLPVPIPEPLARGVPSASFGWPWSVRRWLPGEPMTAQRVDDLRLLAGELAGFLTSLHGIDTTDGPPPGAHNFYRGAPPRVYDTQTRYAIAALGGGIDSRRAMQVWRQALGTSWERHPVWVHGDMVPSNILVTDDRLGAVIDFGCCAVGDPACDLTMAWTTFSGQSGRIFRSRLDVDDGTWNRARGWALWKALVTLTKGASVAEAARARFGWRWPAGQVIERILRDE